MGRKEMSHPVAGWLTGGGGGSDERPSSSFAFHSRHDVGRRNSNWEFRVNMYVSQITLRTNLYG